MLWARAASISFFTFGTAATQRGRWPQFAFIKSSTSSAVVRGSTVTGLSSGTGGSFTLVHSVVMSPALAGSAANAAAMATAAAPPNLIANDVMGFLPRSVDGGSTSRWPIPPTLARVAALRAPNAARRRNGQAPLVGTPAPVPLLRHDRDEFHRRVGEIFTGMPTGRYPFHVAGSALFLPAITVRQAIDKVRVAEPDDDARGEVVHRRALVRSDHKTNHRNGFVFKHQPA